MPSGLVPEPPRLVVLGAFLALSVAALAPVAVVHMPPILDYPNHLARMHILAALPSSPALAQYYTTAWSALPNLALDAIVPALARLMPVEDAMRLFLGLILFATAAGALVLHRAAFGRRSFWPLIVFLFLYNRILLWGFLNYLAGLALMPWALAAWIALEARPAWLRLAVGTLAATALYFAHLAAFGCYGIALIAYAAGGVSEFRAAVARAVPAAATLLPGAVLFLKSPTSGAVGGIGFGNPLRKLDLPVSIFDNYDRLFDGATFAATAIAIGFGLFKGGIILHPRLRWSLLALILAYFVTPSRLLSASGLDHRMPIAIAFLFAGSADWALAGRRLQTVAAAIVLALFGARMAIVGAVWVDADRDYATLDPALELVPMGGRLAIAAPAGATQAGGLPLFHYPTLAVARRDAFVATIFADPAQQPLRLTEEAAKLAAEVSPEALWRGVFKGMVPSLAGYDDLAIIDPPRPIDVSDLPGLIIFDEPRLVLVRLRGAQESPAK